MKQFKTEEEQFRKFITRAERFLRALPMQVILDANLNPDDGVLVLASIMTYKKELGMYQHPDAVKSTKYIEQEINFPKND